MARITACSSLNYADHSLEVAAGRIAARGFRQIDIAHLGYYCTHFPTSDADAQRIGELLRSHRLRPVALNYFGGPKRRGFLLNVPEEADRYRRMMREVLGQAEKLGIPRVMATMGFRTTEPDAAERIRGAAAVISQVADEAHRMGIRITVEVPHAYSLAHDLPAVAEFFDNVTSPHVGACADCSHWGVIKYDFDRYMSIVGQRLCHVHLRDSAGEDTADFKQRLELTPGKGEVDFTRFGALLDKYGYAHEVTLETEYRDGYSVEQIEKELDDGLAYLARCGWELPEGVRGI